MIMLWILGILAAFILLICFLRVGVVATYEQKNLLIDAKIGWFRVHILPNKNDKNKKNEEPKENEKKISATHRKPTFAEAKDAVQTLWPAVKKALHKTRRGIRIQPLMLNLTVGGQADPAEAAQLYGELHAALWGGMPVLEQLLVIPDPRIHIGINFDDSEWEYSGKIGISARVGTLLGIGLTLAIPALKWYLHNQKDSKAQLKEAIENNKAA